MSQLLSISQVLDGLRDVMLAASDSTASEKTNRGHVGDASFDAIKDRWLLLVFPDYADPTPHEGEIEWEGQFGTLLLYHDDESNDALGATELQRAIAVFEPMYLAVFKLVGSPRTGTPFEGKRFTIVPEPDSQGIRVDGFDDPDGNTRIGAKWKVKFYSQAP